MHQFDPAPAVLHQRREAPPDPHVQPHLRIGRIDGVHVVALLVGHHFQRELVVIAEEERPLTVVGDFGRLAQDFGDRMAILLPDGHEHPRHQREVKRHVTFVALAEIHADVRRPLVRFCQQHPVLERDVELAAHPLQDVVGFGQVFVVRAFPDAQIRHGIEPERIDAEVQPEFHHVDDRVDDRRVVVIQVGLMRKEPVPVVLAGNRVVGPVRFLRIEEDDARFGELLVRVAPDVELALG